MGSEAVTLLYPTTVSIAHFLSLSLVPYTVLPVVFIGEATPNQAREPESPSGLPSRPFSFRSHWEYPSFPLLKDPHRCIFPDAPKMPIDLPSYRAYFACFSFVIFFSLLFYEMDFPKIFI